MHESRKRSRGPKFLVFEEGANCVLINSFSMGRGEQTFFWAKEISNLWEAMGESVLGATCKPSRRE